MLGQWKKQKEAVLGVLSDGKGTITHDSID